MWDLLQTRCPNLCELTIDLPRASYRRYDLTPLLRCRWPNLRTLMVEDLWELTKCVHPTSQPAEIFFAAHGDLVSLSTRLDHFYEGCVEFPFLRDLKIMFGGHRKSTRSMTALLFRGLRSLPLLTSLTIWANSGEWDFAPDFSVLFTSCSQISQLELVTCPTAPAFVSRSILI